MEEILFDELRVNETDVDGALYRLSGNKQLYVMILSSFLRDTTINELKTALAEKEWDDAFTAAHALKGLAGNLGFTPLFHSLGELVILIRTGRVNEIDESFNVVKRYYNIIATVIKTNLEKI